MVWENAGTRGDRIFLRLSKTIALFESGAVLHFDFKQHVCPAGPTALLLVDVAHTIRTKGSSQLRRLVQHGKVSDTRAFTQCLLRSFAVRMAMLSERYERNEDSICPSRASIVTGSFFNSSNFSRVISPVQQRLSLPSTTIEIAWRTVFLELGKVTTRRAPTFDLAFIVRTATAHVVAAIPLKPTARIFVIDPAVLPPDREGLRRIEAKKIQLWIVPFGTELRGPKP